MKACRISIAAAALLLAAVPASAMETPPRTQAPQSTASGSGVATSVDAPPHLLLFALGVIGVAAGRRLGRKRRVNDRREDG